MEKVTDRIKAHYSQFTKTQRRIANYISENPNQLPAMSVRELAEYLHTSDATIIRFSQSLGYNGYLDMRNRLKSETNQYYAPLSRLNRTAQAEETKLKQAAMSMSDRVAENDLSCHKEFYSTFDRTLIDDVACEINKAETIYIIGLGTDAFLATFFDWYLGLMGYKTVCCTDGGFAASKRISNICAQDILILFTTPRHLKVEKAILYTAQTAGAYTVCIAPTNAVELSSMCDKALNISERSNEFINSYVTYLSLCNMIIMAIYESNKDAIQAKLKENENFERFFDLFL